MKSKFLEETNREFREFIEVEPSPPPASLEEEIFSMVHRDLNPNPWLIFSKLSFVHFFVGLFTLSLCPQFGLRIFGEGLGLMKYFLAFGTYGCTALCGAFFVGTSLFVSGLALRPEEIRVLKSHRWLQISSLSLLSLGAFLMADREILLTFAVAWIVGSVIGGVAMLELGRVLRFSTR